MIFSATHYFHQTWNWYFGGKWHTNSIYDAVWRKKWRNGNMCSPQLRRRVAYSSVPLHLPVRWPRRWPSSVSGGPAERPGRPRCPAWRWSRGPRRSGSAWLVACLPGTRRSSSSGAVAASCSAARPVTACGWQMSGQSCAFESPKAWKFRIMTNFHTNVNKNVGNCIITFLWVSFLSPSLQTGFGWPVGAATSVFPPLLRIRCRRRRQTTSLTFRTGHRPCCLAGRSQRPLDTLGTSWKKCSAVSQAWVSIWQVLKHKQKMLLSSLLLKYAHSQNGCNECIMLHQFYCQWNEQYVLIYVFIWWEKAASKEKIPLTLQVCTLLFSKMKMINGKVAWASYYYTCYFDWVINIFQTSVELCGSHQEVKVSWKKLMRRFMRFALKAKN